VRQWAKRGTRPRQPADERYDNAYLFGAICPARGVGAALALPYADTDMMQVWSGVRWRIRRPCVDRQGLAIRFSTAFGVERGSGRGRYHGRRLAQRRGLAE